MSTTATRTIVLSAALALATTAGIPGVAAAQDPALVKKGAQVYGAQKCAQCHMVAGKGGKTGGSLDGVAAKLSATDIREWIVNPTEMTAKAKSTKKPPMPAKYKSLPPADLDALVAYMQSLK